MKTVTSSVFANKLLTDTHTHACTHNRRWTSHGHISSPCHFVTARTKIVHGRTHGRTDEAATICSPQNKSERTHTYNDRHTHTTTDRQTKKNIPPSFDPGA
ncbi:hypothetical protein DPMN_154546 [Dreissena polymorpha]|uniref:Uncharacterized protein n=1 Tax=Dreissena polymorpha TaxID=45954 RepID=A0A9D4FL84_DREPO|nr:hypothetical protein DPMN_154546 [Dreissena polymorpha]